MQKGMQTVQRFSIRKCGMGAASVLLGTFLMTGVVLAEEVTTISEVTSQVTTQRTFALTTEEGNESKQGPKENVEIVSPKTTEKRAENSVVTESKTVTPETKKESPKVIIPKKEDVVESRTTPNVEVPRVKRSLEHPKLDFSYLGDDYPANLKNAAADSVIDPWRLWNRECVSFVAHRLSSVNGFTIPGAYGNANLWGQRARNEGYVVDNNPAVGSVAWWRSCHVAWVSAVSGDSVTIEEYNYDYSHRYHKRTIPISKVDGFIHFKDLSASSNTQLTSPVSVSNAGLSSSGTYRFTQKSIIRAEAKQSSPELAHYDAGDSVRYDNIMESDGYKWISYLSYNGNRRYIAIEALSVPTKGSLSIKNQNDAKGTFDIVVSNVSHSNLKEVQVPTWSDKGGQDDIAWYKATKQNDGTYKVTVNISNHKNDRGTYHAHLYYQANDGKQTFVDKITTEVSATKIAKVSLPAKGTFVFKKDSPVKAEAKSASPTLATYDKGEKVSYDKVLIAEGKQWISYISYSGTRRFIQVD